MNRDQQRKMKEGLRQRMRADALRRQCPECKRKSALQKLSGFPALYVCRWCGYEKPAVES